MGYIYNSDFVNILVEETCNYESSTDWVTVVSRRGVNLRDKDIYLIIYKMPKAHNISEWLSPMQRIYYRFCLVRKIMVGLSTFPLEKFESYIRNVQQNPDSRIKEIMNHLFRKSRLGTGGVVSMTNHHQTIDVGLTNFNIAEDVLFTIPVVEKIRLNFFFNVWEFIYWFKEELDLGLDSYNPNRISNINYTFPIFGVPIEKVNFFSPTHLKDLMKRIQTATEPSGQTKQNGYQGDYEVDRVYKEDLLKCSELYYESLKESVKTLEIELSKLLQKFADEYKDNDDEKSTKISKDPRSRIGPRGKLGGSKTKRKQRRRKQKSRTKKN